MFLSLLGIMNSEQGYKCVGEMVKPDTYDDVKAGSTKVSRKTLLRGNYQRKYSEINSKDIENRQ